MTRTVDDIVLELTTAKAAETVLNSLNSTSLKAIFYLMIVFFAQAQWLLEQLWEAKKKELQAVADAAIVGTPKWYASRALEFQYGHALTEKDGRLFYLVNDEAAKIVKKVAVTENNGQVTIKIAKDSGGELVKLSSAERISFQSYINDLKFAGTRTSIISDDADLMKLVSMDVYYDGKLDLTAFKTLVETALSDYLDNIFFDGAFNINEMREAIREVSGVDDTGNISVEMKPETGVYTSVDREYFPSSGYFKIDAGFPLSTQINYIAQ